MELPLRGGCICGAIRYEISQEPLRVHSAGGFNRLWAIASGNGKTAPQPEIPSP